MKIIEKIYDVDSSQELIIERDLTLEELESRNLVESIIAENLINATKAERAKSAAQEKLAALGLTTDDLKALGL
jgi:hypothetical protein